MLHGTSLVAAAGRRPYDCAGPIRPIESSVAYDRCIIDHSLETRHAPGPDRRVHRDRPAGEHATRGVRARRSASRPSPPGSRGSKRNLARALFRRTHSGMVLTPAGRAFLPHAERAIEAIRSGSSLVRELEHGVIGELALAVAPAVSAYVLPEILVRFTERHPDVRLLVRTGHSEEIVDLVAHGRGRPRDRQAAPRRARPQPSALRGRARPGRSAGPSVRRGGRGRRLGDPPRPTHPVRPDVELLRRDERPVPHRRRRPARRHRGRQHRGGQADGRTRAWESPCCPGRRSPMPCLGARSARSSSPARRRSGGGSWRSNGWARTRRGRSSTPCGDSSSGSRSSSHGRYRSSASTESPLAERGRRETEGLARSRIIDRGTPGGETQGASLART